MEESVRQETARKVGTAVVCGIVAFVGAGILWDLVGSWTAVIVWIAIAAVAAGGVIAE